MTKRVAIVGGGIAGLFCAHILGSDKEKRYSVHLFEATKRLGGRIRTVRINEENEPFKEGNGTLEFHAEFGAMRFDRRKQQLLGALLMHLGFNNDKRTPDHKRLESFPAYTSPPSTHDPKYELTPFEKDRDAYQLLQLAIMRILVKVRLQGPAKSGIGKKLESFRDEIALSAAIGEDPLERFLGFAEKLEELELWDIQRYGCISVHPWSSPEADLVPLFTFGFWNLLSGNLSHEGLNKVRDLGTFFHLIPENPNAAEWLAWWLRGVAISDKLEWISGGMETIIDELKARLDDNMVEKMEARVVQLKHESDPATQEEGIRLYYLDRDGVKGGLQQKASDHLYSTVILALPKSPLEKIILRSADLFEKSQPELETLLDSAYGFPLVKVFFIVRNRWWEEDARANKEATRVPTRELHYWKGKAPGSKQGLIMMYADRPASAFWGNFAMSGPHEDVGWIGMESPEQIRKYERYRQNERMKNKLVRYLNENGVSDFNHDDIAWVGIRDWGRDPYGGGNHAWRPKRRYWHVMHHLADLRVHKTRSHVHVCGEAYSDYHGFIEGALRSAVYTLSKVVDPNNLEPALEMLEVIEGAIPRSHVSEWSSYKESLKAWIEALNKDPDNNFPEPY